MKTKYLLLLCFLGGVFTSHAQEDAFKKGDHLLNVGIGLNSYYDGSGIPMSISYEKGTSDKFSVGLGLDYLQKNYKDSYIGNYSFTALYFGVRGSWHINYLLKKIDLYDNKLDIYPGISLGYEFLHWSDNYSANYYDYGSGLFYGIYLGGRYYFTKHISAFAELGATGSTNARIGVGFKF